MTLEIRRLHLAELDAPDGSGRRWPVHGFLVLHPGGAALVDTGVGGWPELLADWRVVNRAAADALAGHGLTPSDIGLVINTHLHFDHCGQNAVFRHAPFFVQRSEQERARRESAELYEWFDFMNARFELLDGDTEILPGLSVLATPGHTVGHQSVVVTTADGTDVLIGDAAYSPRQYAQSAQWSLEGRPELPEDLPDGQAADPAAWQASLDRVRQTGPGSRVHFCHDTSIVHN